MTWRRTARSAFRYDSLMFVLYLAKTLRVRRINDLERTCSPRSSPRFPEVCGPSTCTRLGHLSLSPSRRTPSEDPRASATTAGSELCESRTNCFRRNRFSASRAECERTQERRNAPSSKQTPKPARMSDENCSRPNIVSDCSRAQAIVLLEFGTSGHSLKRNLAHRWTCPDTSHCQPLQRSDGILAEHNHQNAT
jgi:hypothetical protein